MGRLFIIEKRKCGKKDVKKVKRERSGPERCGFGGHRKRGRTQHNTTQPTL